MSTWSQVRVRSRVASRARILASIVLQGSTGYNQCTGQALRIHHPTHRVRNLVGNIAPQGKSLILLSRWSIAVLHLV